MSDQRRLLQANPDPIRLVDASVRDVWTRTSYRFRCHHEDGRGQCTSRDTRTVWNAEQKCVERFCERHASQSKPAPAEGGENNRKETETSAT